MASTTDNLTCLHQRIRTDFGYSCVLCGDVQETIYFDYEDHFSRKEKNQFFESYITRPYRQLEHRIKRKQYIFLTTLEKQHINAYYFFRRICYRLELESLWQLCWDSWKKHYLQRKDKRKLRPYTAVWSAVLFNVCRTRQIEVDKSTLLAIANVDERDFNRAYLRMYRDPITNIEQQICLEVQRLRIQFKMSKTIQDQAMRIYGKYPFFFQGKVKTIALNLFIVAYYTYRDLTKKKHEIIPLLREIQASPSVCKLQPFLEYLGFENPKLSTVYQLYKKRRVI